MRFLIAGDLMVDVLTFLEDDIRYGDDNRATIEFAGGGVSANVAAWMAVAGETPVLHCAVGDDVMGHALVRDLKAQGVEVKVVHTPGPTGAVVALVHPNGERTMFPSAGANALLPMDVIDVEVQPGDHVHISGYFVLRDYSRATALHYIATARENGATVSLDPASARLIEAMGAQAVLDALRGVDLMICNEMESMALSGKSTHEEAARFLADYFPTAIVKLGADGACCWIGGRLVSSPAIPAQVISTVGAGDAFDAAAIIAWKRGLPIEEVLAAGNRNGHLVVQQRGARPA
jgi:sugar/nucleoside kinase (ribokinase family)